MIKAKNHVVVDGGERVYTVQAVSQAERDVYLTDGDNTSIGTWVDVCQVTPAHEPAVTAPNPGGTP